MSVFASWCPSLLGLVLSLCPVCVSLHHKQVLMHTDDVGNVRLTNLGELPTNTVDGALKTDFCCLPCSPLRCSLSFQGVVRRCFVVSLLASLFTAAACSFGGPVRCLARPAHALTACPLALLLLSPRLGTDSCLA